MEKNGRGEEGRVDEGVERVWRGRRSGGWAEEEVEEGVVCSVLKKRFMLIIFLVLKGESHV